MGRISRRKLNTLLEKRLYQLFWQHLADLKTTDLVEEFLHSLLTHTEQVMLAKRLAISVLLSRGFSYQDIDETLKVSKSTIATIQRQLLAGASGYVKAVKKIQNQKAQENFWDAIEELILKFSLPARYGSPAFQRKSELGKSLYNRKLVRNNL